LATKFRNARDRSRIQILVDQLLPGIEQVDPHLDQDAQVAQAVEANVRHTVQQILNSPEGQERLREGRMHVVGAVYELVSGRVRFLE
jgi:carbonic anhydrase